MFETSPDTTPILNASDAPTARSYSRGPSLFRFAFDPYGAHTCYVWSRGMCDALEEAAEWLKSEAPGEFVEPDYASAATELEAPADWEEDEEWTDKVRESAEADLTSTESGYLLAWEWTAYEVTDADEYEAVKIRSVRMAHAAEGHDLAPVWYARALCAEGIGRGISAEDTEAPYTVSGWSGRIRTDEEDKPTNAEGPILTWGTEYPSYLNRPRACRYLTDYNAPDGVILGYLYERGLDGPAFATDAEGLKAALEWVTTRPSEAVDCDRITGAPLE